MTVVAGGALAALLTLGLIVMVWSIVATPAEKPSQALNLRTQVHYRPLLPWVGTQLAVTGLMWWISGWLALGLGLGAFVWIGRLWRLASAERHRYHEVTEAISTWVDMVKDALASGAGLSQAIEATTTVAPLPVRDDVVRLASMQRTINQADALRAFGASLAHPTSDLVVLALVAASESQARDLPGLLAKTAEQARARNAAVLQIETQRSQLYAEARAMVISIGVLGVIISLIAQDFLEPYGTVPGQIVLGLVMAMAVGSTALLVQAGRPQPEPRLLAATRVVRR
ncbi:MAG: hypothetical protein AAF467_17630 [Actinomycetota bacterium]